MQQPTPSRTSITNFLTNAAPPDAVVQVPNSAGSSEDHETITRPTRLSHAPSSLFVSDEDLKSESLVPSGAGIPSSTENYANPEDAVSDHLPASIQPPPEPQRAPPKRQRMLKP